MKAVVTTGHGGYDKLVYRDLPVPVVGPGEILLQVLAAGVNNTDINTRLGWYSDSFATEVPGTTHAQATRQEAKTAGGWNTPTPFPLIQGADCCARVINVGAGVDRRLIGTRVLVRPCMRTHGFGCMDTLWMGSDFDGAFAQFVKVPAGEVFGVRCDWSDVELGSIPCAYGTAENMLQRARLDRGEHVLVCGASGGVGSAVVQLAKRRGARVSAVAGKAKMEQVRAIGADQVIDREDDVIARLGGDAVDLVVDNVAGAGFGALLSVLRRGGRYVSSGAIAGPLVTLDMRKLYLNDIRLIGCTAWDEAVFPNLIAYIERGEIRPLVARTFALEHMAQAQAEFVERRHVGNFVLIPPPIA